MAPLLYIICGSLLALLWLRLERHIMTVLIGFDAGMVASMLQQREPGWVGYILAINGLSIICLALARADARRDERFEANIRQQQEIKEDALAEQQELDRQVDALENRLGSQKELYHSARSLASVISMDSFLHEVRAIVAKFFNCHSGWLLLFEDDGRISVRDLRHGQVDGLGPFSQDFCERIRRTQDVIFMTDQACSWDGSPMPQLDRPWIAVPLAYQSRIRGSVVWLDVEPASLRRGQGVLDQVEMLRSIQHQFALSLSRVLLYDQTEQMSRTDSLTEISKRWYFMQRLREEADRCQRRGDSLALIMVDIDHFKLLNDSFGHLAGDRVLREAAALLRSSLRLGDLACRYGGEEFLLALPSTSNDMALQVAERMRTAIADPEFEVNGDTARITVSLGVASFPEDADEIDEAINRADRMLYRAKWLGRNRTCVYSREAESNVGQPPSL